MKHFWVSITPHARTQPVNEIAKYSIYVFNIIIRIELGKTITG